MKNWMLFTMVGAAVVCFQCAPQAGRSTVKEQVFHVTDELCKELSERPSSPEEVLLACKMAPGAEEIIKILFPRSEWHSIRARTKAVDAGPGK